MSPGVYQHPPGRLSRWGVVDVGLKCVHSCRHCFYSFLDGSDDQFAGMRHARWHSTENLVALIDALAAQGFVGFDVTGGEPTLHPGIVVLAAKARAAGLAMRIITLGQVLLKRMKSALGRGRLLDVLLDSGVTDFRFSLHSTDPAMFNRMTGGELERLVAAMDELQQCGFQYVTNTTITEENYQYLPQIGEWIAARPEIYQANFLFFMPYYQWAGAGHSGDHRISYSAIADYLRPAVAAIEAAGIAATIRYAPQCTIAGMEKNHVGIVGVRHDIHEWMNAIDHTADPEKATPASMREMGRRLPLNDCEAHYPLMPAGDDLVATRASKSFPAKCRDCRAIWVCDGVDQAYLDKFGDGELRPYSEFRGDLIDRARLAYLPAQLIKLAPFADVRGAIRALL